MNRWASAWFQSTLMSSMSNEPDSWLQLVAAGSAQVMANWIPVAVRSAVASEV